MLTENRNGLVVDVALTIATGTAERDAAVAMLTRIPAAGDTLGADKGYDTPDFVEHCGGSASRRTSRSTRRSGAARSTRGRRSMRATRSVSGCVNVSRKCSGG